MSRLIRTEFFAAMAIAIRTIACASLGRDAIALHRRRGESHAMTRRAAGNAMPLLPLPMPLPMPMPLRRATRTAETKAATASFQRMLQSAECWWCPWITTKTQLMLIASTAATLWAVCAPLVMRGAAAWEWYLWRLPNADRVPCPQGVECWGGPCGGFGHEDCFKGHVNDFGDAFESKRRGSESAGSSQRNVWSVRCFFRSDLSIKRTSAHHCILTARAPADCTVLCRYGPRRTHQRRRDGRPVLRVELRRHAAHRPRHFSPE